jgi:ribonuclease HI
MHFITMWIDGSCRGNPGPGGIGILLESGVYRKEFSISMQGTTTNNEAELTSLLFGLESLKNPLQSHIEVLTDSRLVEGIFTKGFKLKKLHLLNLRSRINGRIEELASFKIRWIPRSVNVIADRLAQEASTRAKEVSKNANTLG